MNYQTFEPHPDLAPLISCYWTLEVPAEMAAEKQRIVPDGTIEMAFILGDDIKRFTSESDFLLQPRAMVLGQTIAPFFIQPTGYVNTFAIRFYPHGFANFVTVPLRSLANTETPMADLFGESTANALEQKIIAASGTQQRIDIIEQFLLDKLKDSTVIDGIVSSTIEALLVTNGNTSIRQILKEDVSKRRQLERKFAQQIGISPKQMGKVIRLQSALKMLLSEDTNKLTNIAYESDYYDQAHFIKDFKEFTGISPKEFLGHDHMLLSSVFYK